MILKIWYYLIFIVIFFIISFGVGFKLKSSLSKISFIIFNILFKIFRILLIFFFIVYWFTFRGGYRFDLFFYRNLIYKCFLGYIVCGGFLIFIVISWRRREGENDYRYRDFLYIFCWFVIGYWYYILLYVLN